MDLFEYVFVLVSIIIGLALRHLLQGVAGIVLAALAAAALSACATRAPADGAGPPSLVIAPGQPAPPQARFYADCIAQAAAADTFDREANVLRFRCEGEVAQRFYEGLGAWSTAVGAELRGADGRIWRFSTPIRENPSFVDFCRRLDQHYDCTVVLNVGEFLAQ